MGRKLPSTPRSRVRAALRQLWLRSRERAAALKTAQYCCEECGRKQSRAKGAPPELASLEVHHLDGIEWQRVIDYVYRHILCPPDRLEVMCKPCHDKLHGEDV